MSQALLIINTGSSSIKFCLFGLEEGLPLILKGKVTDIGGTPAFQAHEGKEGKLSANNLPEGSTHQDALVFVLNWLEQHHETWAVAAAVHRIVHGGDRYTGAIKLDAEAIAYLQGLSPLAPLHQPHNLKAVAALGAAYPHLQQFACFDTAFHAGHSPLFSTFALPRHLRESGVRRYGFHGLSYQWIAHCLQTNHPSLVQGKVIVAHLGNGASLCAFHKGKSVDTTMGMTALDGLPMGTRCGALDAGAVLFMLESLHLSGEQIGHVLYEESGLKGLSGISNDVKTLLASDAPEAAFALQYFALKTAQHIASMAVSIGGVDALVFTGGIGENATPLRAAILEHLSFLQPFEVLVMEANEERGMALEVAKQFLQQEGV